MGMTYRPILATNRLTHFHHSPMHVNGYGVSGGSYGVSDRSYAMSVRYYGVRVQSQLGLGGDS